MTVAVKICGLGTPQSVAVAVEGGAAMLGFVFFAKSPRAITPDQLPELTAKVPDSVIRVGLFVDASDDDIAAAVNTGCLDMLQLHGSETPGRVAGIKEKFGLAVMKALPIADAGDVTAARQYEISADRLLFDARPPKGASRPGGNAQVFDWTLLRDQVWQKPWLLAGGLRADNLVEAVRTSGAAAVDISSGVEDSPGMKNPDKISAFLEVAATL